MTIAEDREPLPRSLEEALVALHRNQDITVSVWRDEGAQRVRADLNKLQGDAARHLLLARQHPANSFDWANVSARGPAQPTPWPSDLRAGASHTAAGGWAGGWEDTDRFWGDVPPALISRHGAKAEVGAGAVYRGSGEGGRPAERPMPTQSGLPAPERPMPTQSGRRPDLLTLTFVCGFLGMLFAEGLPGGVGGGLGFAIGALLVVVVVLLLAVAELFSTWRGGRLSRVRPGIGGKRRRSESHGSR